MVDCACIMSHCVCMCVCVCVCVHVCICVCVQCLDVFRKHRAHAPSCVVLCNRMNADRF